MSTDDPEINTGSFTLKRPPELAQDDTPMLDVVKHFLTVVECDLIVLLQPTQPLRKVEHVRAALDLMEQTGADSVVSVAEIPAAMSPDFALFMRGHPMLPGPEVGPAGYTLGYRNRNGIIVPAKGLDGLPTRRQDCRKAYYRDGTVYVFRRSVIEAGDFYGDNPHPLVIPASESCSIDTEDDWRRAEWMAQA